MNDFLTPNSRGEWVPLIPEPIHVFTSMWGRFRCECGKGYGTRLRYREHYALAHVLGMDA